MISPTVAKIIKCLPKGLVNHASKKIVNYYIDKYAHIVIEGQEHLAAINEPIIFICNHLSNSDGMVLNRVLKKKDVTFVAGIKLSNDPVTKLGINVVKTITIKPNSADKEALSRVIKHVKSGNNILVFPEGTRSRVGSMIEAKKGILLIAKLTKAVIIPIGIRGTEKLLPISQDGKMSSENFHSAQVTVKFGAPVQIPSKMEGEERHQYEERALLYLMRSISMLLPESYRGVYALENTMNNES